MPIGRALALGVLQGLTEFLPISSSGHLVLVPWLLGWPDPGLAFDAILHWGTLLAILIYFRRDWANLIRSGIRSMLNRRLDGDAHLLLMILIGTIPAGLAGLLLKDKFEIAFSAPAWVSVDLLSTAALLAIAEGLSRPEKTGADGHDRSGVGMIGLRAALIVGIAQAFAILPGISRSGVTIAAGLSVGLERRVAARYSFLLATPIILAAGLLKLGDLALAGTAGGEWLALIVGMLGAAVAGYLSIGWLMAYLANRRLLLFSAYCAAFGLVSLGISVLR